MIYIEEIKARIKAVADNNVTWESVIAFSEHSADDLVWLVGMVEEQTNLLRQIQSMVECYAMSTNSDWATLSELDRKVTLRTRALLAELNHPLHTN